MCIENRVCTCVLFNLYVLLLSMISKPDRDEMEDFCENIIPIEWADSLDFDGPLRGCVIVLYIYISLVVVVIGK